MTTSKSAKPSMEWLSLLTGLSAIILLFYFVFSSFKLLFDFLDRVNPTVGTAIIAAMSTIFVGLGSVLITQYQIKKRQSEEAHRTEKILLYEEFMQFVQRHVAQSNPNIKEVKAVSENELVKFIFDFKSKMILRGSPEVINRLAEFEKISQEQPDGILIAMDKLYRAMRSDIGLTNSKLRRGELVSMFLNAKGREELKKRDR